MRYFIDTEFIEDGKTIDLVSIGLVCENGWQYYAASKECDLSRASDWVAANVIPHLPPIGSPLWKSRGQIRGEIEQRLKDDNKIEFWGYYADYDWVAFCQLWGTMIQLPQHFPMFCYDIRQLVDAYPGAQKIDDPEQEHHALADALWNKQYYDHLTSHSS